LGVKGVASSATVPIAPPQGIIRSWVSGDGRDAPAARKTSSASSGKASW
jgi:hypothetical protein